MNKLQKLWLGLLSLGIMSTAAWANMDSIGADMDEAGAIIKQQSEDLLSLGAKVQGYIDFIEEQRATLAKKRTLEQEKYDRLVMQEEGVKQLMEASLPYKGTGFILENDLTAEATLELGEEILGDIAKAKEGIQNDMQALTEAEAVLNEASESIDDILLQYEELKDGTDSAQEGFEALTALLSNVEEQFADLKLERQKMAEDYSAKEEYMRTITTTGLAAIIVIGLLSCCCM